MNPAIKKRSLMPFVMLVTLAGMVLASGCARYARTVNNLYETVATVRGGTGEIFIVTPENRHTPSPAIKWVLGKVTDNDNNQIDEVVSPRSPAEIIQSALSLELKKAGYTVIPAAARPAGDRLVVELAKTEINLEQTSAPADIKARCRVLVKVEAFRNGRMIRRLQYEAAASKTDFLDRDLVAASVLQAAVQEVMLKAVPELVGLFKP